MLDQSKQQFGLQIMNSKRTTDGQQQEAVTTTTVEQVEVTEEEKPEKAKTLDEQAMDAILKGKYTPITEIHEGKQETKKPP